MADFLKLSGAVQQLQENIDGTFSGGFAVVKNRGLDYTPSNNPESIQNPKGCSQNSNCGGNNVACDNSSCPTSSNSSCDNTTCSVRKIGVTM